MKEQLIEFETAKLAKKKGFDIECENFISKYDNETESIYSYIGGHFEQQREMAKEHILYEQPSQSLLQMWLRKQYNIEIVSYPIIVGKYSFKIYFLDKIVNIVFLNGRNVANNNDTNKSFDTYEETLEKALVQSLKLIDNE